MSIFDDDKKVIKKENINRGFVTLLYGDSGTGKTFTSLTFPEPIFFIDTENRAINTKKLFKDKNISIVEPAMIKKEINKSMDDIFDEVASINNLTEELSKHIDKIYKGEIKGGTIVIDSVSDIWSWIQSWMYDRLSKLQTKTGQARASDDLMSVTSQLDWKVANNKHEGTIRVLRSLIPYGVNIVFTAKEKSVPEYATKTPSNKEKIRCQKDIPFSSDIIFNLIKQDGKYLAKCEKLGVKEDRDIVIEKLTYEKILNLKPFE